MPAEDQEVQLLLFKELPPGGEVDEPKETPYWAPEKDIDPDNPERNLW